MSRCYDSQVNSVGHLDAEKWATLVFLYVFIIGFPASPFGKFANKLHEGGTLMGLKGNIKKKVEEFFRGSQGLNIVRWYKD